MVVSPLKWGARAGRCIYAIAVQEVCASTVSAGGRDSLGFCRAQFASMVFAILMFLAVRWRCCYCCCCCCCRCCCCCSCSCSCCCCCCCCYVAVA